MADEMLEEDCVETHRVTVQAYLRPDGSHGYAVHAEGDAPASSYLGLLVMAQRDVLNWAAE